MRNAQRARVAAHGGELCQQFRIRGARQQRCQQRVFLRARRRHIVICVRRFFGRLIQVGSEDFSVDTRGCLNNEHAFGRDFVPIRHGWL